MDAPCFLLEPPCSRALNLSDTLASVPAAVSPSVALCHVQADTRAAHFLPEVSSVLLALDLCYIQTDTRLLPKLFSLC